MLKTLVNLIAVQLFGSVKDSNNDSMDVESIANSLLTSGVDVVTNNGIINVTLAKIKEAIMILGLDIDLNEEADEDDDVVIDDDVIESIVDFVLDVTWEEAIANALSDKTFPR